MAISLLGENKAKVLGDNILKDFLYAKLAL